MSKDDDYNLLHNFAHDIKTPLSAVKSYIELIEVSGDLNDRQEHFAHRALVGLDRVQRIISTLLDFARMESDPELLIEVCDLLEAVEETFKLLEGSATERQISLTLDIHGDAQFVQADEHFLGHILVNLIGNAIKYNRVGGHVRVYTKLVGEFVQIYIEDTGIGIPAKDQEKIFKQFYRVEQPSETSIEGTGLGLAIVKGFVERHGGNITLQSTLNRGSTFSFTLPRANSTSSPDHGREMPDSLDDRMQEMRERHEDSDTGDV